MNREIDLNIKEGTIENMIYTSTGRVYAIKLSDNDVIRKIVTIFYDNVSEFMSKEFGSEIEYAKGKTIYLISDKDRLLALRSKDNSLVFVKGYINEEYQTVDAYRNIDYIKDKYDLTEEEFISIVREDLMSKKLKLQ